MAEKLGVLSVAHGKAATLQKTIFHFLGISSYYMT